MTIQINEILEIIDELKRSTPNIKGISVVSSNGLTICSNLTDSEEEKVAAITATLHSLGSNTITSFNRGDLHSLYIKSNNGYIIIGDINKSIVISVVTNFNMKIGVLLYELQKVKARLEKLFKIEHS